VIAMKHVNSKNNYLHILVQFVNITDRTHRFMLEILQLKWTKLLNVYLSQIRNIGNGCPRATCLLMFYIQN